MRKLLYTIGIILFSGISSVCAQENIFTHYFTVSSYFNPAFAGDSRFAQIQAISRIQPFISNERIYNNIISYDQKLINHRSGFNVNINQKLAELKETLFKLNYSYTVHARGKIFVRGGLGLSLNSVATHASSYKFPDQYDMFGYTGNPTQEPSLNDESSFFAFASGVVLYSDLWWFSFGMDDLNRPIHNFAGTDVRVPVVYSLQGSYMFPLDRNKKAKRYFDRDGGLNPYSSLGPVASFYKQGPFHVTTIGINAFNKPVFWGLTFRYNAFGNHVFNEGVSSLNALAGYRNQSISVAYSYDFIVNRTPTNFKGAHEISIIFYLFTIKEDFKKNPLIPLPNQLMY